MTLAKQQKSLANFLNSPNTSKFLQETLHERRAEFVSNLISLADADAKIQALDHGDLMKCALNAVALNLPLNKNLGLAYIVPYKNKPTFQIGYKGFVQLAIRTGLYRFINAVEVREGELNRNKITGELNFIGEKPDNKVVGYIAYLELMTGFSASLYMTEEQLEKHALKYSESYKWDKKNRTMNSRWSDPDERPKMAKKTVLKGLLSTYGVMTTELSKAMTSDSGEEFDDYEEVSGRVSDVEVVKQPEPQEEEKTLKI